MELSAVGEIHELGVTSGVSSAAATETPSVARLVVNTQKVSAVAIRRYREAGMQPGVPTTQPPIDGTFGPENNDMHPNRRVPTKRR